MTTNKIHISGIIKESVVDGPGLRYTIFTQGCKHKCEGCHNPETHSMDGGSEKPLKDILIEVASNPKLDGITYSGGEPLLWWDELLELTYLLKSLNPKLNFILYTGYTWDQILGFTDRQDPKGSLRALLEMIDFIVDGRFEKDNTSPDLKFKGSSNQTVYAIHKDCGNLQSPYVDNNWDTYSEIKK